MLLDSFGQQDSCNKRHQAQRKGARKMAPCSGRPGTSVLSETLRKEKNRDNYKKIDKR
jgi:hypothetical protein